MAKSIALAADASRLASLLLGYYQQYAPSSRLAGRAPRPRSSTDLAIRGPLASPLAHSRRLRHPTPSCKACSWIDLVKPCVMWHEPRS